MSDAVKARRFSALMQSFNYRCDISTTSEGKSLITIYEHGKEGDDYVNRVVGETYESCIYAIMRLFGNAERKHGSNHAEQVGRPQDFKLENYRDHDGDWCSRYVLK